MSKMIAMVVPEPKAKLQRVERDVPKPDAKQLLLRVHACGVCHSDSLTVEGLMPGIVYPRVPGHEVIGKIEAIGANVEGWQVGDRAGVGWFGGSCGYCLRCRTGDAFACLNVHAVTGVTSDGGYATHVLADVSAVAHVPDDLDSVESAPLLCAGVTTFNALRNSGARPGELVAVLGVGGLGHLAVQYAARQGFFTVAVNRGREKEMMIRSLGAHEYIDSAAGDPAAALQKLGGAKVILATVTNADAMQAVVGGLGPNGTMMVIGAVGGFPINTLDMLGKRSAVKGWYSGIAIDSEETLQFSKLQNISPMNEIYPFEQAQAAYDRMMSGKARFRVVLKME
ncbi:MAG TPA: alcohol dehydrogenase [Bryobacteraceae bacterium]|jgi:D-arabinose 1-dehydrogenase-like Zn-dependent alcohol dehydrogenase|nr:alcohol dehydrogenase [Bryobacteraceae bacterium]